MGFPPGIISSETRNPPEEWNSVGNNQLIEADSDRQAQNTQKILKTVTILGSATTTPINSTTEVNAFKKFKYKDTIKIEKKDTKIYRDHTLKISIKRGLVIFVINFLKVVFIIKFKQIFFTG
jgi:hypothetical protein